MSVFSKAKLDELCLHYRKKILQMSQDVTALHIAPAFSCLEMLTLIFHHFMEYQHQQSPHTFILSKGHGAVAQYVILNQLGILSNEDLQQYCTSQGRLGAHPDLGVPGISASTGSLGHGLGIAVGIAYGNLLLNKNNKTLVVISDGELQEGSTWEALLAAANLKLSNLVLFIDLNDRISINRLSEEYPALYPIDSKLNAFGWHAQIVNGHDINAIFNAYQQSDIQKPNVIICQTVKGKGVSYMETSPLWHYRSPNPEEYQQALKELA